MTATPLRALVSAGSGPGHTYAGLRTRTRPVRAMVRASAATANVGRALPPAVLGADLLAVVSDSLRRAIDLGSAAHFVQRTTATVRSADGERASDAGGAQPLHAIGAGHATPDAERDEMVRAETSRSVAEGTTSSSASIDRVSSLTTELGGQSARALDGPAAAATLAPRPGSPGAERSQARSTRATPLESRLREYWRRVESRPAVTSSAAVTPGLVDASQPAAGGAEPAPSRVMPPAPRLSAPSTLPSFAPLRRPDADARRWRVRSPGSFGQEHADAVPGMPSIEPAELVRGTDLAEQLADLLSEQASRHGIDVP